VAPQVEERGRDLGGLAKHLTGLNVANEKLKHSFLKKILGSAEQELARICGVLPAHVVVSTKDH
jgi:hypothetical protein